MTLPTPPRRPHAPLPGLEPLATTAHRGGTTASPAPASAPPDATSRLFDPALYHYDPVSRCGLPYDGMRPCSCGGTNFVFVTRGEADRAHVVCQRCYYEPKFRLLKSHDLIYANLDVTRKKVTYNRPLPEIIALRSRIKAQ